MSNTLEEFYLDCVRAEAPDLKPHYDDWLETRNPQFVKILTKRLRWIRDLENAKLESLERIFNARTPK